MSANASSACIFPSGNPTGICVGSSKRVNISSKVHASYGDLTSPPSLCSPLTFCSLSVGSVSTSPFNFVCNSTKLFAPKTNVRPFIISVVVGSTSSSSSNAFRYKRISNNFLAILFSIKARCFPLSFLMSMISNLISASNIVLLNNSRKERALP